MTGIFRFRNANIDVEIEAETLEEALPKFVEQYPEEAKNTMQIWKEGDEG